MAEKICSKCGETKPADAFYTGMGRCKSCHNTATRKYALAHPEQVAKTRNKWRSKPGSREKEILASVRWSSTHRAQVQSNQFVRNLRKRGLTLVEYNQMCARQDFRCAICGSDDTELHVDHNHDTDKVRGLLCSNCNTGIGLLKDNPVVLDRAAQYVS